MNDQTQNSNPLVVFKKNFKHLIDNNELALPSNVNEDAFKNAAIVAVQDNANLLNADQQTLFKSIRKAAAAGLVPDGREGALVTFKTKDKASNLYIDAVQWMPMVFGLIKMARRSGTVADIRAHIVYQAEVDQEKFHYVIGDNESLTHEPILFGDRGEAVAAYAIAKLNDGTIVREFMSSADIDTVRRSGSSQKIFKKGERPVVSDEPQGIWKDWASEMWKKTVIRRLTKRLDLSSEDVRHIQEDDDFTDLRDVTPEPEKISKFAAKAMEARGEPVEGSEAEDAEIIGEDAAHWTDEVPLDPHQMNDDFAEGVKAFEAGFKKAHCPHENEPEKAIDWIAGWVSAEFEAQK